MAILKCKMCGGDLTVSGGEKIVECEFFGTTQTIPTSSDENLQGLFNRANVLRMKSEFDKAEQLYEKIIQSDETQAEAYWGLILCKYGIEYVEDPTSFKRIPTCHRTSFESVTADEDYKSAISYADTVQRDIYEAEAKEIDRLQKEILALSEKEEPYDVFICYKETDNDGKRTQDSVIANDIYHQLTQEGLKVFYAAITLEDKLGSAYEPYIFAALNSSKVMLVIGTKPEYFNAVWVKNEWSRYLKLIQQDRTKTLIPCYRDMDAYELPEEFAHLQAQDMSKIGFINDVVRGIKKITNINMTETEQNISSNNSKGINVDAKFRRIDMAIEDGEWDLAQQLVYDVMDAEPENAKVQIYSLIIELRLKNEDDLTAYRPDGKPLNQYNKFKRALEYATGSYKSKLKDYLDKSIKNYCRALTEKIDNIASFKEFKAIEGEIATITECEEKKLLQNRIMEINSKMKDKFKKTSKYLEDLKTQENEINAIVRKYQDRIDNTNLFCLLIPLAIAIIVGIICWISGSFLGGIFLGAFLFCSSYFTIIKAIAILANDISSSKILKARDDFKTFIQNHLSDISDGEKYIIVANALADSAIPVPWSSLIWIKTKSEDDEIKLISASEKMNLNEVLKPCIKSTKIDDKFVAYESLSIKELSNLDDAERNSELDKIREQASKIPQCAFDTKKDGKYLTVYLKRDMFEILVNDICFLEAKLKII